jgi:replication-associated recombination protein RarA
MSNIILQDEQIKVYEKLHQFLKNDKLKEIILIGYAGTGKTTMITKFLNDIISNNIINKIVIAAPTHKAVNIVKSKLFDNFEDEHLLQKINIMTIHRLLNYQSYIDSNGKKYCATSQNILNWNIYKLIVIIIATRIKS